MLHAVYGFRYPYCAPLTTSVARAMCASLSDSQRMDALRRLRDWICSNDSPLKPAFGGSASEISDAYFTTHEPATGLPLVYFRQTSTKELNSIVAKAAKAQQIWWRLLPMERSKVSKNAVVFEPHRWSYFF